MKDGVTKRVCDKDGVKEGVCVCERWCDKDGVTKMV